MTAGAAPGMLAVGLTGGIGTGKSAVAELLVAKGALLVDADVIAREVVAPGGPAYQPMIDRFGSGILDGQRKIDRPTVAAIVFGDPRALADLNAITHPAIGAAMIERRDQIAGDDNIVVLDIPLLKPMHRKMLSLAAVVVVDAPMDAVLDRLINDRGMSRADAEARIAAQIDRQARLEGADLVVDNSRDRGQLSEEVARVWDYLIMLQQRRVA